MASNPQCPARRNNLTASEKFQKHLPTKEDLYGYLGNCENGQDFDNAAGLKLKGDKGVGTFGGSEDHTAIVSCTAGNLNMFSYCDTRFEQAGPLSLHLCREISSCPLPGRLSRSLGTSSS